jgi:hypothetical protein
MKRPRTVLYGSIRGEWMLGEAVGKRQEGKNG